MTGHFPEIDPLPGLPSWARRDHTDRSLDDYCGVTGLDLRKLLIGKRVLDLGSGKDATFVRQIRELGIAAVGMNPNWGERNISESDRAFCFASTVQKMPFDDQSFDFVVSLGAVPMYLPGDVDSYTAAFEELHRVMAEDSWALLDPIYRGLEEDEAFIRIIKRTFGDNAIVLGRYTRKLVLMKSPSKDTSGIVASCLPKMHESMFPII